MPLTTVGSGMFAFRSAVAVATLSRDVASSTPREEVTVSRMCKLPSLLPLPEKRLSPVTSRGSSVDVDDNWALPLEMAFGTAVAGPPVAL